MVKGRGKYDVVKASRQSLQEVSCGREGKDGKYCGDLNVCHFNAVSRQ